MEEGWHTYETAAMNMIDQFLRDFLVGIYHLFELIDIGTHLVEYPAFSWFNLVVSSQLVGRINSKS